MVQELEAVDAPGYRRTVQYVTCFVGTERLDDISETIHMAHDFEFVEIVFFEIVLNIFDPFIDTHHLQVAFLVQAFPRGDQACTVQVKAAQPVPVTLAGWSGNAFIHGLDDGVR